MGAGVGKGVGVAAAAAGAGVAQAPDDAARSDDAAAEIPSYDAVLLSSQDADDADLRSTKNWRR